MSFSQFTNNFLNIVVNPLDANSPAQVPDLLQWNSLCLVDSATSTNPTNNTLVDYAGLLIWLRCHYSNFDATNNANPNRIYTLNWCGLTSSNQMILSAGGFYVSIVPINMTTILGGVQYSNNNSMITSCRVMSMGLQVLSNIETVTTTTVNYMTQVVAGQLSSNELQSIYNNSTDALLSLRNSQCSKVFSNSQGCCVRYNPFQNDDQLNVLDGQQIYSSTKPFDWYKMPVVAIKFSQNVAPAAVIPVILNSRFWLEASLRQPTPIYSQPSPVEPNWSLVKTVMTGCNEVYPLVTTGHSFTNFLVKNPRFQKVLLTALRGTNLLFRAYTGTLNPQRVIRRGRTNLIQRSNVARRRRRRTTKNGNNNNKTYKPKQVLATTKTLPKGRRVRNFV